MTSTSPRVALPRERLERTASPFSELGSRWLLVPLVPVLLVVLVIGAGYTFAGGDDPGFPDQFSILVYGVVNVGVLAVLYVRLPEDVWRGSALFRSSSIRELAAAFGATVVGVLVGWPLTTLFADAVGIARYSVPSLASSVSALGLLLGAVIVAPVAEEVLYRGLFVGIVIERGYGPLVAGGSSLVVFALVHVFTAGLAGVFNALLLGALLTWLRLRFDNLAGAWLMHSLNNVLEFLIALSILPSFYAL